MNCTKLGEVSPELDSFAVSSLSSDPFGHVLS